jgi:CubicO group peptidase (beta-lactamase class C family)
MEPVDAAESGLSPIFLDSIETALEAHVTEGLLAGAVVGVARNGRIAWTGTAGVQDLETAVAMSDRSVFRMYSMTKAVTATAAMILHERGAFELDDAVAAYLPAFGDVVVLREDGGTRTPSRPITVRDLLFHTAGLSHRSSSEYREAGVRSRDTPLPHFIENITAVPLRSDPGTRFRYSASPTVVGHLVEIWSGQTLDVFLAEEILVPLGMVDTGFQVRPDQLDRFASVSRLADGLPLQPYRIEEVPFTERPVLLEGAVGLVSTVPDFLRFAQMLANGGTFGEGRILSEESVDFLTTNGIDDDLLPIFGDGHGWGAGSVSVVMDTALVGNGVFPGEYRWDGSAGTEFWVDPASGTVLVSAWQSAPANPGRIRQRIRHLVREAIRAGAG